MEIAIRQEKALQRKYLKYCSHEVGPMERNVQEVKSCTSPKFQNFWMSGRCPDNFWIENGIIGNMNKLGIIAWDYEMFFHGSDLYV